MLTRRQLEGLEFEEFAEAFGLLAGDGDFGLFFVVHFQHEAGFEPGDDFLDVVDVDEIGAVGTPEGFGLESGEEFFQGAVVGGAFDFFGGDGDEAAFDGGEDEVFGVDQEHALLGSDEDFGGREEVGLGAASWVTSCSRRSVGLICGSISRLALWMALAMRALSKGFRT